MLNVEILNENEGTLEIKVSIPKRHLASEPVIVCQKDQIREEVEKEVRKKHKSEDLTFLSNIKRLRNIGENDRTEQTLLVKIKKEIKKKKIVAAKAKTKKELKS
tara:strand:- start:168 stop:479 length:312 start_codon:yes stop_codon:yes gene_type:complete